MARLIVKSPYIKCGGGRNAGGYLRYIGTRERVELLPDGRPPTQKQERLVLNLMRDFPDVESLGEYKDYAADRTRANASALISTALENHWEDAQRSEVYMKYIVTRPRAERLGAHGLFGDEDHVDLPAAMEELERYEGNVWTHIISLKREDAERYGFDHAETWRNLLRAHRNEIAEAMHIPPNDFRWYAAFHNEGHHPHVHMMAWSVKPGQAYLNRDGIRQIRSQLTNDVFKHEMLQLYEQKSASRDALVREARRALMELADRMQHTLANGPAIEDRMQALARTMNTIGGKHQYGYLKKPVKRQVDEIVNALEDFPIVRSCYERWMELQDQVDSYYKDEKRARCKLSEQKEFRAIKNAVIRVADQINAGALTFEDRDARELDERDERTEHWAELRRRIEDSALTPGERRDAAAELESLAEGGDADAQLLLGRLYRDGGMLIPDAVNAAYWLDRAARQDITAAQYALGKLLLAPDAETHDAGTGLRWLERAARSGHSYAAYRLGKEHLTGTNTEKDVEKALDWLTQSTKAGNPFAQYALGKLYLDGTLVQRDVALGMAYMERSARQGNAYAQLFIDRRDSLKPTSVMLAATRLLHQAASIFRENALPKTGAMQPAISRKRMQKLIEQKGYKAAVNYAREQEAEQQYSGMRMATPW